MGRDVLPLIRRSQWACRLRSVTVTLMGLAVGIGFLFGGVVTTGATPSVPRAVPETAPARLVPVSDSPPDVTSRPAPLTLSATGLTTVGRAFSYGYDIAEAVATAGSAQSAVQVGRSLAGTFEDVPIMGWGIGNPEPAPGEYDFAGIARQISFVEASGGIPVITLCAAPDWMKGGQPGTTNWSEINVAPVAQHFGDFAALSAAVAKAFPEVKYFVVWNELKGFWSTATNSWNIAAYTSLYNDVFQAIRSVRPDALVGGPYVSMSSSSGTTKASATPSGPWGRMDPTAMNAVVYWLAHRVGADFIAVDGTDYTKNAGLITDPLTSTEKYAVVDNWLRTQTSLPIVWMESHLLPDPDVATPQQQAALRVAALLEMASSGASVGLQWNPQQDLGWDEGLWAPTGAQGTFQPTALGQELPAVLAVLAAPVTLVGGLPAGTVSAEGIDGNVTVTLTPTQASVVVDGQPV